MNTNERDRKASEYAKRLAHELSQTWSLPNQMRFVETLKVIKRDYESGWDACESSERVRGLREKAQALLDNFALKKTVSEKMGLRNVQLDIERLIELQEALAAWGLVCLLLGPVGWML